MALPPHASAHRRAVLVSDFDGTLTRRDFYQLVRERLLPADAPDYWTAYREGRITHFEALRAIFASVPADESTWLELVRDMELDPNLAASLRALHQMGWDVVVVSAGCAWYIDRLLADAGVSLEVHANPGRLEHGRLVMQLPIDSPYFSAETGIDKAAVVRAQQAEPGPVAFAGDGPPDLEPARLVLPSLRFARGHLAETLRDLGEAFRPFDRWSEIAEALSTETR